LVEIAAFVFFPASATAVVDETVRTMVYHEPQQIGKRGFWRNFSAKETSLSKSV
jgi:hypothetical protein